MGVPPRLLLAVTVCDRRTVPANKVHRNTLVEGSRAIGAAVGASHPTIINDLAGGQNLPPDLEIIDAEEVPITGLDGKNYTVTCPTPKAVQPAPSRKTTTQVAA